MLNDVDINDFLRHYWQQKPVLIRNALPGFQSPLTPDEMAGLACEDEIESRIIVKAGGNWSAENGPFEEKYFSTLPDKDWTLLVQAVDHYIPEVAELLEHFRFIPNWRIDDIMASYAVAGGSVGPHYDNYDVFLIQGAGKREWQLGQLCDQNSALQNNPQIRLLEEFHEQQRWVLEAGDMLYLPPRYAHWGTGLDNDCITYSVGFRAPSHGELLSHFCDERLSILDDFLRYTDPELQLQNNPGEISPEVIDNIQKILLQQFNDKTFIANWFGRYMTEAKYNPDDSESNAYTLHELKEQFTQYPYVLRNPACRFAYLTIDEKNAILFINGESFECPLSLAEYFNANTCFNATELLAELETPANASLLLECFNRDHLLFDDYCDD